MKFTLDETQNNRLLAAIFQELAVIVFDPQRSCFRQCQHDGYPRL